MVRGRSSRLWRLRVSLGTVIERKGKGDEEVVKMELEEVVHGRSGTVALPRVMVVLSGWAWCRARRVERAVEGRRSALAMFNFGMMWLAEAFRIVLCSIDCLECI